MSRWQISIITLFLGGLLQAQVSFEARLDTQQIKLGEPIILEIEATLPNGSEYVWPRIEGLPGIDILNQGKLDSSLTNNLLRLKQQVKITSFDSGAVWLPSFQFIVDSNTTLRSDSLAILVYFPQVKEDQDYFDIKGPREIPINPWVYMYWSAGLILLGLIIWRLIVFMGRRPQPQQHTEAELQISALDWALEKLEELAAKELWQNNQTKLYYSELIDILRGFVERQFGQKTMELTSEELVAKIRPLVDDTALYEQLKSSILLSAMVKFAKQTALAEENELAFSAVKRFIMAQADQTEEGHA